MICYINELTLQESFRGMPAVLREKEAVKMEEKWQEEWGVRLTGNQPGLFTADISGATKRGVVEWLQAAHVAAVDLEASDIPTLCDHKVDPVTLELYRLLQSSGEAMLKCSGLTPDEIFPTLHQLSWDTVTGATDEGLTMSAEAAVVGLKGAGIKVPAEYEFHHTPTHAEQAAEMDLTEEDLGGRNTFDLAMDTARDWEG
jgi:hypothetical protein